MRRISRQAPSSRTGWSASVWLPSSFRQVPRPADSRYCSHRNSNRARAPAIATAYLSGRAGDNGKFFGGRCSPQQTKDKPMHNCRTACRLPCPWPQASWPHCTDLGWYCFSSHLSPWKTTEIVGGRKSPSRLPGRLIIKTQTPLSSMGCLCISCCDNVALLDLCTRLVSEPEFLFLRQCIIERMLTAWQCRIICLDAQQMNRRYSWIYSHNVACERFSVATM